MRVEFHSLLKSKERNQDMGGGGDDGMFSQACHFLILTPRRSLNLL